MSKFGTYKVSGIPVSSEKFTTGNVYFVDSGSVDGSDNPSSGSNPNIPFVTIDYAVDQCTANNGDVIYVMPGHAESVSLAGQIDLDVAGISVIGIGNGTDRPTLTYTVAAGEVVVGADNVTIENIVFNAAAPDILLGVTVEDSVDYCTIRECNFEVTTAGTDEFATCITVINGNVGTLIEDNFMDMKLGNATEAILLDADTDRTTIRGNTIRGDYSTANIFADTALSTQLLIKGNTLENGVGGDIGTEPVIELITNCQAIITENICICNVASNDAAIVADLAFNFNNWYSETVGAAVGIADSFAAVT